MAKEVFAMRAPQRNLFLVLLLLAAPLAAVRHWVPLGPFGGSVSQIAVDPSDERVVYAVNSENVLFKSVDGGGNWTPIRRVGFGLVGRIAIDPVRHGTIYVTSDQGLLKSVDGGASWNAVGPRSDPNIHSVAVDPAQASRVYAGGARLWISTNRGASWKPARAIEPSGWIDLLIAARRPVGTVFATSYNIPYKSVDGGWTWEAMSTPTLDRAVGQLAVAPSDSRTLYASSSSSGSASLFRSTDGGDTWQRTGRQPALYDGILSLAVSPHSPRTLWIGTQHNGLFLSKDGGDTWTASGLRPAGSAAEVAVVAVAPSASGTVYTGLTAREKDIGGIVASTDGGGTWARRNRGLFGLYVSAMAVDPSNPGILWAGDQGGLFRSANAGQRWVRTALPAPPYWAFNFYSIVLDPAAPSTVAYALCDSLWRTQDGGASWTDLFAAGKSSPYLYLSSLRMGPEPTPALWGADEESRLLTSSDAGLHWVVRAQPDLGCGILDFAFAPSSASTLYMTGADGRWWNQGMPPIVPNYCDDNPLPAFFRSDDGGTTWTELSAGLRLHLVEGAGRQIAVDPVDPRLVYIATMGGYDSGQGDGVWKSTDGGATWERAGNAMKGRTVTAIVASPVAGVVWASADGRVYRSSDAGATWRDRTGELLARRVYGLILDPSDPDRVYAHTSTGVWVWEEDAP
jgi:photosystem II stability/assembly factor-like uncharacterized protein